MLFSYFLNYFCWPWDYQFYLECFGRVSMIMFLDPFYFYVIIRSFFVVNNYPEFTDGFSEFNFSFPFYVCLWLILYFLFLCFGLAYGSIFLS